MLNPETQLRRQSRHIQRAFSDVPPEHSAELRRLARALIGRTDAVVAGMGARTGRSGVVLDDAVEDSFAQVGVLSTVAVAKWMAGEGVEVARDVGQESWCIFGQLAAQRRAPLNEVTKRCLRWFDAACDVAAEAAGELALAPEVLMRSAMAMLQRSLNVTLVRMCESFEAERKRSDDELTFLATHDVLTGLPNRKLILDRTEQLLARARRDGTPLAAVFIDLDNFKLINDTLGHRAGDELLVRGHRAAAGRRPRDRHARTPRWRRVRRDRRRAVAAGRARADRRAPARGARASRSRSPRAGRA